MTGLRKIFSVPAGLFAGTVLHRLQLWDAVMQSVFETRPMEYPEGKKDDSEAKISAAFGNGYLFCAWLYIGEEKIILFQNLMLI